MNKRQKAIFIECVIVIAATAAAVIAMVNLRDWVNRSEAVRAMTHLGRIVVQYRQEHRSIPPEPYLDSVRQELEGHLRLGTFTYRGRWIDFESPPDEILAYAKKDYSSLLVGKGYVVLRQDGTVQWLKKNEFETLLRRQQSPEEIETLKQD
jgi:hypothetical protein